MSELASEPSALSELAFAHRLEAALDRRGPVCAGIDPHAALLSAWELPDDVGGLERFALTCASVLGETAAVVKPQSAFFERFGAAGVAVLERTVAECRAAGALVVLDVKRGDIGSTMAAYAEAYLDPSAPLAADATTVSPYLGVGALQPAFDLAQRHGGGVFVLARTSNPEGGQVQHAIGADGRSVAQQIVDDLAGRNHGLRPFGPVGAVVGATVDDVGLDLTALNGPLLVPGIGAQGGTADDVRRLFDGLTRTVLPSVSREVLRAGPDRAALRAAVSELADRFAFLRA